jgi:photosystem II stability/assembly factor-like uncharacterized protein
MDSSRRTCPVHRSAVASQTSPSPLHPLLAILLPVAIALAALAGGPLAAATPAGRAGAPPAGNAAAAPLDPDLWKALRWREVGPYRGGRADAVVGLDGDRATYYFGATGGGVWKTTDAGRTWQSVSDGFFGGSIGAVAVSNWDPNVVYAGTGEETVRGNVSEGDGMWKSTDAGRTWKHVGLADSRHIARIRIHPKNPDLVYAAVLGHLFGRSSERGVYRSSDGGATWKRVLYVDDAVGAVDLAMDPANPRVLYAGTWRILRTPYSLESGGAGSGLWKSTDGGDTWTDLSHNPGLPKGTLGIVGVSISRADPDNLYAMFEAKEGGVFRSRDAGKTWQRVSSDHELTQRAWYYNRIYADPVDVESVYVVNVSFLHSKDGGRTFTPIPVPHGDNHDLWLDPADPRRMIEANDGGVNVSTDGGHSWTPQDNQPTAQIYRVSTDTHFPYRIYGAQQDNSALRIASRGTGAGIGRDDWQETAGGESGYILADPANPEVVYGGSYGGLLIRLDHQTGEVRDVNPWPDNPMGAGAADLKYRFQWNFPIATSPHDRRVLYVGANVLFKSRDGGQSWSVISPDLTRNDKTRQGSSGGPITQDNTSVEYYDTLFTIAESPLTAGVLWVGSDDGLVHVSRDNGATWQDVTPPGLPKWVQVNSIDASPYDAGGAYVAATLYRADDEHPYLYKTSDYGAHWTRIDSGIAPTHFTRVVRADPARRGMLYAGTQRGVYVSFDDGGHWQPLQGNLPIVPIGDLALKDGDLIAATEGRGFWVLDDLEPLRELAADPHGVTAGAPLHLFTPATAVRLAGGGPPKAPPGEGQNPPTGVVIDYWLRDAPAAGQAPLKIEILDHDGKLIRGYSAAKPASPAPAAAAARGASAGAARGEAAAGAKAAAGPAARGEARDAAGSEGKGKDEGEPEAAAEGAETGDGTGSEDPDMPGRHAPKEPVAPAARGFNRFVWDLTWPAAKGFPGMVLWNGRLISPHVAPGSYQVRVSVAGQSATVPFTVVKDPRTVSTDADLVAQERFLIGIRDKLDATHDALRRVRAVRAQIADLGKRLSAAEAAADGDGHPADGDGHHADADGHPAEGDGHPADAAPSGAGHPPDRWAAVRQAAHALDTKLAAVEEALYQNRSHSVEDALNFPIRLDDKLNGVASSAAIGDYRPTAQAIAVRDELEAAIDVQLQTLAGLLAGELASFNRLATQAGVEPVIPPHPQVK